MNAGSDGYAGIAAHYDLQHMDWYASMFGRRLLDLLASRGLSGASVLDAGCGSGTLALALARAGHHVTGVDLSASLLAVARAKDRQSAVDWRQGDITRLELGQSYDAITCVADVLNHLEHLDAWEAAFRSFARHLRPGGWLFFDVLTCIGLARQDTFTVNEHAGRTMILGIIYEPSSRRSTLKITSFAPAAASGAWHRASETITEWGQPVAGIFERLARAGCAAPERPWAEAEDAETEERLAVLSQCGGPER